MNEETDVRMAEYFARLNRVMAHDCSKVLDERRVTIVTDGKRYFWGEEDD